MKKAIVIGINYRKTSYALPDCEQDAKNLQRLLLKSHDEVEVFFEILPSELLELFNTAAKTLNKEDTLTIVYSGHGTQVTYGKLESDGINEALCLFKDKKLVCLLDKDLKDMLSMFSCKVLLYIDSCYSWGMRSIIAQEYQIKAMHFNFETDDVFEHRRLVSTNKPEVVVVAACSENQTSVSTGKGGLFTLAVIDALENKGINELGAVIKYAKTYCKQYQTPMLKAKNKKEFIF